MSDGSDEIGVSARDKARAVAEKAIHVEYCGQLREQAGVRSETVQTGAGTAADLWEELRAAKGFSLDISAVRAAINESIESWDERLRDGDRVALFPPFSGG